MGFSDQYIAKLWKQDEVAVYNLRKEMNLFPVYKMIETSGCGGYIPYFYSTYEKENDSRISDKKKIIVLGSGPIRIGQGVEFDYSTVFLIPEQRFSQEFPLVLLQSPCYFLLP